MAPKNRSQTARSRPPNPSSLVTLEEELGNLHVEDDRPRPQRPTQPPSPDYDPADERREAEGIKTHKRFRKIAKSVTSSQKDLARDADPNNGRCLVTNRPDPVQSCHLVARATNHETVRVYISRTIRLYLLHPTRSSRSWSMYGGLNIKISMSTRGIT